MQIKKGFVLREVAGQAIVIATGDASMHFHGMIKLNDTGEFIWKALEQGNDKNEIINALTDRYDVAREQATADASRFINQMCDNGLLEQ